MSPVVGLVTGIVVAAVMQRRQLAMPKQVKQMTTWVLQASVVLLGFGMNIHHVLQAAREGVVAATIGIGLTLVVGTWLGRLLQVPRTTTWLIAIGTAICGGSAIAACAPVLGAKDEELSASMGIVFALNAIALVVFVPLGHALSLSDHQFGVLAALAIHDTSSVVGAASAYSAAALQVAVTIKLARALFILPMPLLLMMITKGARTTPTKPWFVLLFICAAALVSWWPAMADVGQHLAWLGKQGLVVALFGVGLGLSTKALRSIGIRPLVMAVLLWLLVIVTTLTALLQGIL
jgi:uncharacterized integral membrane protein (TIGR00698 family)